MTIPIVNPMWNELLFQERTAEIACQQRTKRLLREAAAAQQHSANAPTWLTARWRVIQHWLHLHWVTVGERPTVSFTTKP